MDGDSKILTRDEVLIVTGDAHAFGDIDLLDKVRNHDAAMRADRAALVALVKDFAADQIEAFISRKPCIGNPPDAPEEFYLVCDHCGGIGAADASNIAHDDDCDVGKLLARARAVQS